MNDTASLLEALSLDSHLSESEFLARELGICLYTKSETQLVRLVAKRSSAGKRTILVVSDWLAISKVLPILPPDSVIVLLLSDEAYRCKPSIFETESDTHIFRNYSIERLDSKAVLAFLLGTLRDLSKYWHLVVFSDFIRLFHALLWGALTRRRVRRWRIL